ncbi:tyrosine-type recombinase/integrase [Leclercia adecarboxylata]|uniref:tyrosine-type recombinase/integrase n=1 Tax=Leclercia adecarboxylata TaxID=83655 RepID=UPI003AF322CE
MPNNEESRKSRYYSQNTIKLTWSGAMRKAGVRHRSPYHTRHTFACWLLSAGANPSFIASQMGHKNARMNDNQIGMLNAKLKLNAPTAPPPRSEPLNIFYVSFYSVICF